MAGSVERVEAAARDLGLPVTVRRMPASTRSAGEAAAACGCDVARIVKSLVFLGAESGAARLFLVSGAHPLDPARAAAAAGETLARADAKAVRRLTGFAIGGVAPIGHPAPVPTWIDETLLAHRTVWAAAGAPDAVFEVAPADLARAVGARAVPLAG